MKLGKWGLLPLLAFFVSASLPAEARAEVALEKQSNLTVIKGVVRDSQGNPIADAMVAVFRLGTDQLLRQVRSAKDGSFLTRVLPGKYTVLAVAEGFNPVTLGEVEVNRANELNYGFRLERSGSGNTLPEKRLNRNSSRWRVIAAQSRRSVYQAGEGDAPVAENESAAATEETVGVVTEEERENARRSRSIVETYFADAGDGSYAGFNFATLQPLGDDAEVIVSGQTGTGENAPTRFETAFKMRPNDAHQIRVTASAARLGSLNISGDEKRLGQVSFQALDEWRVRDGVILVLGFDYSRFVGAGDDAAISPRFGLQFDIDAKTRFRTSYTAQAEEKSWARAIELEDSQVAFREPFAMQEIAFEDEKPVMNKSRRLEFGIERILDNESSVEATAFFDSIAGRGVGLVNVPLELLSAEEFEPFTANQQGAAKGFRLVYSRRFNSIFSVSAGYSFGSGQRLSAGAVTNGADVFENGFFQSFVGQVNADLRTGTRVKTIYRLSPQATVFAIDPFAGKLAIYDPGLSVLVTQSLPTWGLPVRAEATFDARNLFGFQTNVSSEEGSLRLNSQGRVLRGGISLRF